MTSISDPHLSARGQVSLALGRAAERFPDLDPRPLNTSGLAPRDAGLALAIHRTVLQRWITLEFLLDRYLRQPMHAMEPALRGVMLAGAAQIIFMDRLPLHAVVDESVALARALVRPGAAGLVNAVLRRLGSLRAPASPSSSSPPSGPWEPGADRLPTDDGFIRLAEAVLPHPNQFVSHLSIATSHPMELIQHWVEKFGATAATAIARHGIVTPPTIIAVEPGFAATPAAGAAASQAWLPHAQRGFIIWNDTHDQMVEFLAVDPARRVQDPASTLAMAATASLHPKLILDYCAGRGTKTRQLAQMHPEAEILATDIDPERLAALRTALAKHEHVRVLPIHQIAAVLAGRRCDLVVLDVPCSNTAVLARRPEARYRFNPATVDSLMALQRQIVTKAAAFLAPAGTLLYSTCSLEEAEDHRQATWLAEYFRGQIQAENLQVPGGSGPSYHDGSYYAMVSTIR